MFDFWKVKFGASNWLNSVLWPGTFLNSGVSCSVKIESRIFDTLSPTNIDSQSGEQLTGAGMY